jgi:hypothetical protein
MVLSGARPMGTRQATGCGPGSADANPHDAYRLVRLCRMRLPQGMRVLPALRIPGSQARRRCRGSMESGSYREVGVGTMVTHGPLHRAGRAGLLHPAPTLGGDEQALVGPGLTDAGRREPLRRQACPTTNREPSLLAPTAEALPPSPGHGVTEGREGRSVSRYPIVAVVPEQDHAQVGSLFRDGLVEAAAEFVSDLFQLRLPPFSHRLPQHRELPLPGIPADVREAEEVEGQGLPVPAIASVLLREAAELDQAVSLGCSSRPNLAKRSRRSGRKSTTRVSLRGIGPGPGRWR